MKLKYLLLLILSVSIPGECIFVVDILKMSQIAVESLYKVWEFIEPKFEEPNAPIFHTNKEEKLLMAKVSELNRKLNDIQMQLKIIQESTLKKISLFPRNVLMHLEIMSLLDDIDFISRMDRSMNRYMKNGLNKILRKEMNDEDDEKLERYTLENFAMTVVDHDERSVIMRLERIHDYIVGNVYKNHQLQKMKGLFVIFNEHSKASDEQLCDLSQSTNQLIFNMYTLLQMVQLKAYTMIQFSWMLLRVYNKGNFSMETNLMKQSYLERMSSQAIALKNALNNANNDLWKCDPKVHSEGETYTEITRFLQGFIVNEVDLNSENTCRENCAFYKYTKQHSCFKNQFCSKQTPCKGNVVGCTFVDSDMWICQAPRWTKKRYDWIEYENGRILGEKKTCSRGVTKVNSWWRWLFWHCSYCFCFCDDSKDPLTNRYFNLREITSDVQNNKVITGIRFVKSNGIIHIQIQEGNLEEYGVVNSSTITWKPVDNYNIESFGVVPGIDYHMLTWEHRAIDLDDLILPKDYLLTGIKFRKVGGHLNLEIRGSQFNVTSGKLIDSGKKSRWISNDNTDGAYEKPRTQLHLYKPDVPTKRSIGPNEPDSKSDQYVEFTSTDVDADVSQSAVPFIDTQWVTPNPPIPLVGAGIYHKGARYSGGFVAMKVFTYDYSDQIISFFPELNEAEFKK